MPSLEPVDYDPFARLTPVDYDPWDGRPMPSTYEESRMDAAQRRLEPVDHDPFSSAPQSSSRAQEKFNKIADAVVGGAKNWIETPGRAMREGITTDQAVDWAAPTALGMVAGARLPGGAPEGALGSSGAKLVQPEGIRAYHGSPHDFDRFDLNKIGTGEGAQAYGHGLYFAENEGVARSYRDALGNERSGRGGGRPIWNRGETALGRMDLPKEQQLALDAIARFSNPKEAARFLSTARLSEGPGFHEARLKAIDLLDGLTAPRPAACTRSTSARSRNSSSIGISRSVSSRAGIPGIRYLDQGSRMPTSDFTVWAPRVGRDEQFVVRGPGDVTHAKFNTREEANAFADRENAKLNPQTHNYVVSIPASSTF
jgi:hypothetical protein